MTVSAHGDAHSVEVVAARIQATTKLGLRQRTGHVQGYGGTTTTNAHSSSVNSLRYGFLLIAPA